MNIVLITLDSVRAGHLGCYGYTGTDTPAMDRIAAEGVLFEQAFCQAPNTWVSHASIMTGRYPNAHGLRLYFSSLDPHVPTMAETLQKAGFATAGYPAHSLVGSARGFERGFDMFDEEDLLYESTMGEGLRQNRPWEPTLAKAAVWMKAQDKPFFVWLHYMGTHWEPPESISVPEEMRERYSPVGQFYDAKISYADQACVAALWDFLADNNLLDDTLLIITADHGEDDLTRNDPPFHNQAHNNGLDEQVMRVPWIMRAPRAVPAGIRIPHVVRLIDLMPTALALAGVATGGLALDGVNLTELWSPQADSRIGLQAYMENAQRGYAGVRSDRWKLMLRVGLATPQSRGLQQRVGRRLQSILRSLRGNPQPGPEQGEVSGRYQYSNWQILDTLGLFDVATDPVEINNLHGRPEVDAVEEELARFVMEMVRMTGAHSPMLSDVEQQTLERTLKDLGYLE